MAAIILSLAIILLGAAFAFKAQEMKDWMERVYDNPRMTRHMNMRGYVLSMRLVGIGWLIFGGFLLGAKILH